MRHLDALLAATAAFFLSLPAVPAQAQAQAQELCLVEYKAKRDNPLELFYDVAELPGPCTRKEAREQIEELLEEEGLILLKILSVSEG